jgi:Uma2 family endonuclease
MAVAAKISVEEYLKTSYRPDCDYVDGEVQERNLGEFEHSSTQGQIVFYVLTRYPRLKWRVLPEQRVQVTATRFRIPDVCILAEDAPREKIIRTPPLLCIEVMSPCDTLARIRERAQDYFAMGVPVCWIIDPVSGQAWTATPDALTETTDGILRAGDIEMPLGEVLE